MQCTSLSVSPTGTGLLANTSCLYLCGQILVSFGLTSAVKAIIACYSVWVKILQNAMHFCHTFSVSSGYKSSDSLLFMHQLFNWLRNKSTQNSTVVHVQFPFHCISFHFHFHSGFYNIHLNESNMFTHILIDMILL